MIFAGFAAACAASWVAAPFVAVRRHGTLDDQRLEAIRDETRRLTETRRDVPAPVTVLPQPRPAPDADAPSRVTSA